MSDEQAEKALRWFSMLWPIGLSIVGGISGVYFTFIVLQHKVTANENKIAEVENMVERYKAEADATRQRLEDRLGEIQRDVSYIRGTLEKR